MDLFVLLSFGFPILGGGRVGGIAVIGVANVGVASFLVCHWSAVTTRTFTLSEK
jgi:hypothetical protein